MDDTPSRASRNSVILYAGIRREGRDPADCRVRNLSTDGACVDNSAGLAAGERLSVDMGAIRGIPGEVMWVERGFAGVRFGVPVDLAAARQPRSKGAATVGAGWVSTMAHAYRRGS